MLIPANMCLYLPWVGLCCRQLIWRFWPKKTKKKVYLTPKTFSANHVRVCPTGQNRFHLRLVAEKEFADYQKSLTLRNTAKTKALDIFGKVEKVKKENWNPPDPWVYSNKENIYVSDLESDIEETHSSQG